MQRTTYVVRYANGATCGHQHKTKEACARCVAKGKTIKGAPGRTWGIVRLVNGVES